MSRRAPKSRLTALDSLTTTPPPAPLPPSHVIARIVSSAGQNLFAVACPAAPSSFSEDKTKGEIGSTVDGKEEEEGEGDGANGRAMRTLLVELAPMFRKTTWLRRGGYVLVDTAAFGQRENKIQGLVVNVVRDEREWRRRPYWPEEFRAREESGDEEEDEESVVGKLPPNSDDEED